MESITLTRRRDKDDPVDEGNLLNKCIICNENGGNITSTENGRNKIREAASIRRDRVWDKLSSIKISDLFYYHVSNNCYKNYCHKKQ